MSKVDDQTLKREFAKRLGVDIEEFDDGIRNPMNREVLNEFVHKDEFGVEAKLFSVCFQEIRNLAGPYKVFGSR